MIRILFVCLGNICRSPMAEFVMKDIVKRNGLEDEFCISSAATCREQIGNPVHYGTKNKLAEFNISVEGKYAVQLKKEDYDKYDYIIGMDSMNIKNINRIIGSDPDKKVFKLLEFGGSKGDVADPWYTGDFNIAYNDILKGCEALFKKIILDFHR